MHPRSLKQLELFELELPTNFITTNSVGYLEMIRLMTGAAMILTDSGGIQEEAYILKKPLITLRSSTERPETLSANFIVDADQRKASKALTAFKQGKVSWSEELGVGQASQIIVKHIQKLL